MIKSSIKRQYSVLFTCLMAGIVALCIIFNTVFLESYYQAMKIDSLKRAYRSISEAAINDGYATEAFQNELNTICNNGNIKIFIMDATSHTKYASVNGGDRLELKLLGYIFGFLQGTYQVLEENNDYMIVRSNDNYAKNIEIYGTMDSGISFIMQTPLESIRESAMVANRFFLYIGLAGTALGAIVIWLASRRVAKPIMELSDISKKMVHLDFDAKYSGKSNNEIDVLGENINQLSISLEKTIGELKTANSQLQSNIDKREQIDAMRQEFLSNVSHELKTPIALIQGYSEGLLEGMAEDPESRRFYLEVILDEAKKMNLCVQKLLELNRLEFGTNQIQLERMECMEMIKNCIQSAEILVQQKNIIVCCPEEAEPLYVWADAQAAEEVFVNYLTNAIHYCEDNGTIRVYTEKKEKNIRIHVFNTGDPIPEDSLGKLWDKFYKVDKARTREYGGSGIGLSIVKAYMEAMHQKYGVFNCENGVCFWFELELA